MLGWDTLVRISILKILLPIFEYKRLKNHMACYTQMLMGCDIFLSDYISPTQCKTESFKLYTWNQMMALNWGIKPIFHGRHICRGQYLGRYSSQKPLVIRKWIKYQKEIIHCSWYIFNVVEKFEQTENKDFCLHYIYDHKFRIY